MFKYGMEISLSKTQCTEFVIKKKTQNNSQFYTLKFYDAAQNFFYLATTRMILKMILYYFSLITRWHQNIAICLDINTKCQSKQRIELW